MSRRTGRRFNPFVDRWGSPSVFSFVLIVVTGSVLFIGGLFAIIIPTERHFGRISCHTFSVQTGRPTKFVLYNWFSTGDCLTPTAKGKWIPVGNLREFGR